MKFSTRAATAAMLVAGQLGGATSALAETLKISTFLPPNHAFNRMLTAWGEELSSRTDGDLTVEIFPAGQLGPPPRQFDLVRNGVADISVVLHGATPGRFPMSELAGLPLTAPSGGNDSAIASPRLTALAPEYLAEEHAGTHILWMAVTPPLKMHFRSANPSDLSVLGGLRVRYAGTIWQQIIESVGASPVPVPPAETADALGKGVIDAATFPFEATESFDLAPVIDYSMEPGLASATFAVVMGDQAWDRLSEAHRALVAETTGVARAEAFGALWDQGESKGRQYMIDGGVEIVTLTEAQLADLHARVEPIVDSAVQAVEAKGRPGAAFVAAYTE